MPTSNLKKKKKKRELFQSLYWPGCRHYFSLILKPCEVQYCVKERERRDKLLVLNSNLNTSDIVVVICLI